MAGLPAWNDMRHTRTLPWAAALAALFVLPALHPLLIPLVGVPSHLLWWVHVLPVALLTFRHGRAWALGAIAVSATLVVLGERQFGAGYGTPATSETIAALAIALTATNALVAGFALYARRALARYRLLYSNVRVAVLRVDRDGTILEANPAAAELAGARSAELVGRSFGEVVSSRAFDSLTALEQRGGWAGELEIGPQPSRRTVHAVLAVTREPDTQAYQVIIADRSTEVLQEREIERQARLSTLGEALAGVAHELNNPLAVIMAHVELARLQGAPAAGTDDDDPWTVIAQEAARMRDMVRELVTFSRRDETTDCVDTAQLLERIARVQRITLGKRMQIALSLQPELLVEASPLKIEQIVVNLLSNAAYAIRANGGTGVTIATRADGDSVEVEVRDDGPGIDASVAPRLFEPFATSKPPGEGTGLGLAISRRLARAAGGDLTARNVEPKGAAFTLRLPRARPGGACAPAPRAANEGSAPRPAGTTAETR